MPGRSAQESNQVVLSRFERETDNTIVHKAVIKPSCKTFYYVHQSDIANAGSDPTAFERINQSVRVIKLLKPFGRTWHEHDRNELEMLQGLIRYSHPNLVQLIDFDQALRNWMQTIYVGPSILILDIPNPHALPGPFLWSIFQDVSAGLGFLHWGLPPTWVQGDEAPEQWNPIAHGSIGMTTIHLDMNHQSYGEYPRAVLSDFSKAEVLVTPSGHNPINASEWKPSKLDVSMAACVVHKLAHRRPYEARKDPRTGNFCKCLTASKRPEWLIAETMDKQLASVLEMACNPDNDQLTSKALLGHIKGPQLYEHRFPDIPMGMHEGDIEALSSQLPTNSEIRAAIPQLEGVFTDEELEEIGHNTVTEDAPGPTNENASGSGGSLLQSSAQTMMPNNAETWENSSSSSLSELPDDWDE